MKSCLNSSSWLLPRRPEVTVSEPLIAVSAAPSVESEPVKPGERFREPEFILTLRNRTVIEGSTARLASRVMGVPEPAVQWYKDGHAVNHGGRAEISVDGGGHTLIVKDCQLEDAGQYTCDASSKAGSAKTSAILTVQGTVVWSSWNRPKYDFYSLFSTSLLISHRENRNCK